jgi:hypothetical protein
LGHNPLLWQGGVRLLCSVLFVDSLLQNHIGVAFERLQINSHIVVILGGFDVILGGVERGQC